MNSSRLFMFMIRSLRPSFVICGICVSEPSGSPKKPEEISAYCYVISFVELLACLTGHFNWMGLNQTVNIQNITHI